MMIPSISSDTEGLSKLMPQFLEQTKDRLTKIEAHRQAIHGGNDVIAEIKAICGIAHTISGTADTFGFSDLGAFARRVEKQYLIGSDCPDAPMVIWSHVENALIPLVDEIEHLIKVKSYCGK